MSPAVPGEGRAATTLLENENSGDEKLCGGKGETAAKASLPEESCDSVLPQETKYLKPVKDDAEVHPDGLSLEELRRALPAHVFKKDLFRSIRWMLLDLAVMFITLSALKGLYRENDALAQFRAHGAIGQASARVYSEASRVASPVFGKKGETLTKSLLGLRDESLVEEAPVSSDPGVTQRNAASPNVLIGTLHDLQGFCAADADHPWGARGSGPTTPLDAVDAYLQKNMSGMNASITTSETGAPSSLAERLSRCALYVVLYTICGFFMWANFVVGHDCGHGSFSESTSLNFLFGLLTHGAILVPFQSWARSHRKHHLNHNHFEKDYSFPWSHDPKFDREGCLAALEKYPAIPATLYPIFGYAFYLIWPQGYGGVDGTHFFPKMFKGCRLWDDISNDELIKCWISVAVVFGYLYLFFTSFFDGPTEFAVLYLPSWFVLCFNLYTVTFLQHHAPETKIYDDTTWKYSTAAFETVDRTYGSVVDLFHHHISDCHVIHHIFFTKIPHYNLPDATEALKKHLENKNLGHLYQFEKTRDFFIRVFVYSYKFSTRAKLVTKDSKFF
ncbi:unnamed protein product [Amoebophrya sp. A25]|nr:unnamed protein product [Amoebophrya sp. A25]|eukprot:GSA25T00002245001.1